MSNKLYISMYHYTRELHNSRYPGIKGMEAELFDRQIQYFSENFCIITMEMLIEAINGGNELPEKALLLTFDDGYIDNYLFAFPILKKYGVQGSFFIPGITFTEKKLLDVNKIHFILSSSKEEELLKDLIVKMDYYRGNKNDYEPTDVLYEKYAVANRFDSKDTIFIKRVLQTVLPEEIRGLIASELFAKYVGVKEEVFARELYMNREQIRVMKESGMFIGMHGYKHYWLANLSESELHNDLQKGLEVMDEFIDSSSWVMNYPYGNYSNAVIEMISANGCELGLTTEVRMADLDKDSRFTIPRLDCNDFPPISDSWTKY